MNIIILGAGRMSHGLVFDLLKNPAINQINVIDRDLKALDNFSKQFNNPILKMLCIPADNLPALRPVFEKADGAISAVPYDYNPALTELTIATHTHFVDLGGNNRVVEKQFRLSIDAKKQNVAIFPDCGLAPGMSSIIAAYAIDQLARVDDVKIRVGGLPIHPMGPLKYKLVFSVHGLINEYIEPASILMDGKIREVECLTETEMIEFPSPFSQLEAFYTSGGTSTLPITFEERVTNLDYKTIRYPGHCYLMKSMIDLGFSKSSQNLQLDGKNYTKRELFEALLESSLQYPGDDVVLIRITARGQKEGREKTITMQAIEYGDTKNNLTAMMRTTAFPAAIILQMILSGDIKDHGVLKQETSVPGLKFITELEKRRIFFKES